MFGIINANVISKGRFGRTREIEVSLTSKIEDQIVSILKTELDING
jgi:Cdc6-like AAA superfamily ATPase